MLEKPLEKYFPLLNILLAGTLSLIVLAGLETIMTVGFFRLVSPGLKAGNGAQPDSELSSTDYYYGDFPVSVNFNKSQPVKQGHRSEVAWKTATKASSH